jgi:hypothetical protein
MEIPKETLPSYYFEDSFDEFDEGVDEAEKKLYINVHDNNME